jgi:diguanylate cyclase (GGDEF)-like protein/PAS domain S-box-containing protein
MISKTLRDTPEHLEVTMQTKTKPQLIAKSQLIAENATLRARLAELEDKLANQPSGDGTLPESDSTERKRIEDALKASEVRYRRLFETAKDGILILNGDTGEITDVNPFLQEMLGYSHAELLGKTLWEIGPFRDIAASQYAFRQLQNKEYIRYENLPLEAQGQLQRQVEFISNVYLVNGNRVIQCNIRDITARKHAEAEVQKANEELLALVTELQRRDSEMRLLNQMSDMLQTCNTQDEAYKVIALIASEMFPGQKGCLAILHTSDQYLGTVACWGGEALVESIFAFEECWAMRSGHPHEVIDHQTSLLCSHFVHQPETGYLCVPLAVQGEILGLLCLIGAATREDELQTSQQQLAVTAGETIKLSLSNLRLREKLREEAIHDILTGVFNRRYLEETLPRDLYHAQRRNSPLCVAMLDLDHFKRFNDTFGHSAGDALLRELGQILRVNLRKSDISCRYGGEEFVLVLPDSSLEDTRQRIEQISVLVKNLQVWHRNKQLGTITMSVSIAVSPEHGSTASELLRAADNALYAAKQAGRDRVVVYEVSE